jgi:Helix-turn-helix domain
MHPQPPQHAIVDTGTPRSPSVGWTPARIRALGAVTNLPTAAEILGLSRSVAYDLAHRDEFPVAIIRAGTRYRIPVAALLEILRMPLETPAGPDREAT